MTGEKVCAVIVTYHPSRNVVENISKVRSQVQGLVVVDNGSFAQELDLIRTVQHSLAFHLIANQENLGVAEALNQGVRWAKSEAYPWVLLLDQDSTVPDGFIGQMFAAWEAHPDRERVGSLHPRYEDPESGSEVTVPRASDNSPILPMTSGALMPVSVFERLGWFATDYFVDLVDWEYSFRLRSAGYFVVDAPQAKLLHSPGAPRRTSIFGRSVLSSQHSAMRRYYISRNSVAFYRKYFFAYPRWILQAFRRQMRDTIVSLIAEENRGRKLRSFLLGTWHGLIGRMGKREEI